MATAEDKLSVIIADHNSVLCSSLHKLKQERYLCDIEIQGQDGSIAAHSVILSAASSYLKETIKSPVPGDSCIKVICVENENISHLSIMIDLLYTGSITCSQQDFGSISRLLKLFQIDTLVRKYEEGVIVNLGTAGEIEKGVSSDTYRLKNNNVCLVDTTNEDVAFTQSCIPSADTSLDDSTQIQDVLVEEGTTALTASNKSIESLVQVEKIRRDSTTDRKSETVTRKGSKCNNDIDKTLDDVNKEKSAPLNRGKLKTTSDSNKSVNEIDKTTPVRKSKRLARTKNESVVDTEQKNTLVTQERKLKNATSKNAMVQNFGQKKSELQEGNSLKNDELKIDESKLSVSTSSLVTVDQTKQGQTQIKTTKTQLDKRKSLNQKNSDKQQNTKKKRKMEDSKTDNDTEDKDKIQKENISELGPSQNNNNVCTESRENLVSDESKIKRRHCRKCRSCSLFFEDVQAYLKHRELIHPAFHLKMMTKRNSNLIGQKRTFCKPCNITFPNYKSFVQHRKDVKHIRKNHLIIFKCSYCEYSTKVGCYLDMHKIKKHGMDPAESQFDIYKCNVKGCDYFNLRKSILEQHMMDAHGYEKSEVCEICGKTFRSMKQLKGHIRIHVPKEERKQKFECPDCDRKFERKADFMLHYKHKHKKEKSFLCHLCPYGVTAQRLLDIHLFNVHDIALPDYLPIHHCTVCDYSTPYKYYLEQHINRHKGEASFKCHICEKAFKAKPNLTAHIWRHKTQNKKCPYEGCKYEGRGQKMKEHIKFQHTHKDERPFHCPLCNYEGKTNARLKSHLQKFHKMKSFQDKIPIIPVTERRDMENVPAVKQIAPITTNGNIVLDTMVTSGNTNHVDSIITTEGNTRMDDELKNSPDTVAGVVNSSEIPLSHIVVKNEVDSDGSVSQVIVGNEILSAIQDPKNIIIYHNDGLQYGALEVVDY